MGLQNTTAEVHNQGEKRREKDLLVLNLSSARRWPEGDENLVLRCPCQGVFVWSNARGFIAVYRKTYYCCIFQYFFNTLWMTWGRSLKNISIAWTTPMPSQSPKQPPTYKKRTKVKCHSRIKSIPILNWYIFVYIQNTTSERNELRESSTNVVLVTFTWLNF